jgi:hypothetical protein
VCTATFGGSSHAPVRVAGPAVRFSPVTRSAARAAFGAGAVRTVAGDYLVAFLASGLACIVASLLVLRIANQRFVSVAAE